MKDDQIIQFSNNDVTKEKLEETINKLELC